MAVATLLAATPLNVLDLAPIRQGGNAAQAYKDTLELAQAAERWGYRRYWLAEHHNISGIASAATSVLIGYVAAGTSKIRVGSGGVMLPNHAPLAIAEQFGTLETLYPGRIDLGLGRAPGGDSAVAQSLRRNYRAGEDFPELLSELRGFLDEPRPGQLVHAFPGEGTHVPIWLLGSSGFSAQLAGQLGLPFAFAAHFQPDGMMPALDLYRSSFRPSEILQTPYCMVGIPVVAAASDEEARFLATTQQQKFLNLIRNRPVAALPPVDELDWDGFEEAAVRSKLRAAIVGSPETVGRKLHTLIAETGVDEVMIATDTFRQSDRLRSFEIVAKLRSDADAESTFNKPMAAVEN